MAEKEPPKKTKAQLQAEKEAMMAKAAIKQGLSCFSTGTLVQPPDELIQFWDELDADGWSKHLELFTKFLKGYKQVAIKKLLFDIEHHIKDCQKLIPTFKRSKEEILLMVAIGEIDAKEFKDNLEAVPSNRERLDRKIHKQIRELDWQDDQALVRLDELTDKLDNPKIKKSEIEEIESEIKVIEDAIATRKLKREELALKLVEWKARGNIDIASEDGQFRLDA